MEIAEAIRRIKEHIEVHCAKEPRAIYISEALYMGIDALEKQMPQKTITRNGLVRTERGYELLDEKEQEYCSKCNRLVQPSCEKYCSYCGQAIYFE